MIEFKGEYSTAQIFTDCYDTKTEEQVKTLTNQEVTKGSKIRIMPDCHPGSGCVIGTTMTITEKIVPALVGVDIGCGINVAELGNKEIDYKELDEFIWHFVPTGVKWNGRNKKFFDEKYEEEVSELIKSMKCINEIDYETAMLSMRSLGGGNHFIEVDKDEDGNLYLLVHTGSRHTGHEAATYYMGRAFDEIMGITDLIAEKKEEISKTTNNYDTVRRELNNIRKKHEQDIPIALAYLYGNSFDDYIHDMKILQKYAALNRKFIVNTIAEYMDFTINDMWSSVHNYINTDDMILRKGAISAREGEKIIIPINMKDGSLICVGKGNEDWNYSAPHGAGRAMTRMQAKKSLKMSDFREEMKGIYSTSVSKNTIDESPMAYKSIENIINNLSPTADIIKTIKPVYNFKSNT